MDSRRFPLPPSIYLSDPNFSTSKIGSESDDIFDPPLKKSATDDEATAEVDDDSWCVVKS